jgi:uncharacterized protein YoxC
MEFAIVFSVICFLLLVFLLFEITKTNKTLSRELTDVYGLINSISVILTEQQRIINEQQAFINDFKSHIIKLVSDIKDEDHPESKPILNFNIDNILDKISKNGINSLTKEELDFLKNIK